MLTNILHFCNTLYSDVSDAKKPLMSDLNASVFILLNISFAIMKKGNCECLVHLLLTIHDLQICNICLLLLRTNPGIYCLVR